MAREPSAAAMREPAPGAPRVEVIPSRSRTGHRAGDESVHSPWAEGETFVERRQPVAPPPEEPLPADEPERHEPSQRPDDPRWTQAAPPPPPPLPPQPPQPAQPLPPRPSFDPRTPPRVEETRPSFGDESGHLAIDAPYAPAQYPPPGPPQRRRIDVAPWVVAAVLAGWLTIVALLLALLLDG
jgi:hypothetical protein